MSKACQQVAVRDAWPPYVPSPTAPWNLRRVVHLHRRAGFAATWSELQRDLRDGPKASIDRLLSGRSRLQGVPGDFASVADTLARVAVESGDLGRLKAWWIYRMLLGPDPLGERLTLFWHNHFATSANKVGMAVHRQNKIFREYARAPFAELLTRVVHDPALLIWLDAQANRKDNPNENLARELMELFTLGIGHFNEADVKEAARALTGWTVVDGRFREDAPQHDPGEKSILGRKGTWRGDNLVQMLLDHPATAERLAARLCEHFMGEGAINAAAVADLARGLRQHQLDIGWAIETVLRSETFFAEANLGTRILGPVEFIVGAARALELFDPPPNTLILAELMTNLGQELFCPPNVGGWPGGRAWISTRSAIGRYNYAVYLLEGSPLGRPEAVDVVGLAQRHGRAGNLEALSGFYSELLLGNRPTAVLWDRLLTAMKSTADPGRSRARDVVAMILASPEAQLA